MSSAAPPSKAAVVANFKKAVETGKVNTEKEHKSRQARYRTFNVHTEGATGDACLQAQQRFAERESKAVLAKCKQWTTADFEGVKILGEGSFGVVHLVNRRGTDEYYALKEVQKERIRDKNRECAFDERKLLAEARSRWFVELFATFQDAKRIYMVMEFLQGGDLVFHLMQRTRFTKEQTSFYMAELLEALDTVHKFGFVHRDVKPDNMVLTAQGHLKLLDFGLCKSDQAVDDVTAPSAKLEPVAELKPVPIPVVPATRREQLRSVVGTPEYMAPEVYKGDSSKESDIWSLGVIACECLIGRPPFAVDSGNREVRKVRQKVLRHKEIVTPMLKCAVQKNIISSVSQQFLHCVLCEREQRLSADNLRRHPFFFGLDFDRLHEMKPPIVPPLKGPGDAACFDDFGKQPLPDVMPYSSKDRSLQWAHYEFNKEAAELLGPALEHGELFAAGEDPVNGALPQLPNRTIVVKASF